MLPTLLVLFACATAPPPVQVSDMVQDDAVTCDADEDCGDGEFCNRPVGECEGEGSCLRKPEICTAIFSPVCGCDGKTHSNRCVAASKGVSVDYESECTDSEG